MPHSGSAFSTSSNTFWDARYQNECWYSIARLKYFCASGLHDVSKFTLPSVCSDCAKVGCASKMPVIAVIAVANGALIIVSPCLAAECERTYNSTLRMQHELAKFWLLAALNKETRWIENATPAEAPSLPLPLSRDVGTSHSRQLGTAYRT